MGTLKDLIDLKDLYSLKALEDPLKHKEENKSFHTLIIHSFLQVYRVISPDAPPNEWPKEITSSNCSRLLSSTSDVFASAVLLSTEKTLSSSQIMVFVIY